MSTLTHQKAEFVARRLRLLRLTKWMLWSLFAAGALNLVLLLAGKLELIAPYLEVNVAILGAAGIFGAVWGLSRRKTPFEAARVVDSELELKERMASALEFERKPARGPIYDLQAQDAAQYAAEIDVRAAFPYRFTREAKLALGVAVALAAAAFLPQLPLFQSEQERAEKAEIKRQGARVVQLSKRLELTEKKKDKPHSKLSRDLEDLGKKMQKGRISKKEALKKLGKFSKELELKHKELAERNVTKSYKQAVAELKRREAALPELPEDMKKLAELEKMAKLSESLEKRDFDAASKALEDLSRELGKGKLDPKQLEQLKKRLEALARSFKGTDLDKLARLLEQTLQNLDLSNLNLSAEELQKAAELLRSLGEQMLSAEELKRLAQLLEEYKQMIAMSGFEGGT